MTIRSRHTFFYTVLLLAVCAVAAVALFQRIRILRMSRVAARTADIVPRFKADDVSEVKVSWRFLTTTMKKVDGKWEISERENLPADSAKIASFLDAVTSMRPLKVITPVDRGTMARLRVLPDEKDPKVVPGIHFVVKNGKSEELLNLVMGRGHFVNLPDDPTPQDQRVPDGRYLSIVKKDGSPVIFLTPGVFEDFHPVPGSWLQSPVFANLQASTWIEFRQLPMLNPVWMISRLNPSVMFTAFGPGKHVVSRQAVSSIFMILSRHYIADAHSRAHYKDVEPSFASFTVGDYYGVVRTLRFYRAKSAPQKILFSVESSVVGKRKVPGIDPQKMADEFTAGRKDVFYEMPAQVFDILKTPPFEQNKK